MEGGSEGKEGKREERKGKVEGKKGSERNLRKIRCSLSLFSVKNAK